MPLLVLWTERPNQRHTMRNKVTRRLLSRGRRGAQTLRRVTWAEWKALGLAGGTVMVVAVLLRLVSFRRVRRLLSGAASRWEGPVRLSEDDEQRLLWAVAAVSRRLFPARPCLTQALAAQVLLRWKKGRPAQLRIGVARADGNQIQAHAWLERDGNVLIGGTASPRVYSPLSGRAEDTL